MVNERNEKPYIVGILCLFIIGNIYSQNFPTTINYQALLKDNNGYPINGNVTVAFKMYDSLVAGNLLWTETQNNISSQNGIINTKLGVVTPFNQGHFMGGKCFLEMNISGYGNISPRIQFTTVPFAMRSLGELKLLSWANIDYGWGSSDSTTYTILDTVFAPYTCTDFLHLEILGYSGNASNFGAEVYVYWGPVGAITLCGKLMINYLKNILAFNQSINIPIQNSTNNAAQRVLIHLKKSLNSGGRISNYFLFGK